MHVFDNVLNLALINSLSRKSNFFTLLSMQTFLKNCSICKTWLIAATFCELELKKRSSQLPPTVLPANFSAPLT